MKYTVNQLLENSRMDLRLPQLIATAAVTIGGFSMGNVLGWSSPALPDLEESAEFPEINPNDQTHQSWIGSLVTVRKVPRRLVGAFTAALLAGMFSEKFGRKSTMLVSSLFFLVGWGFISLARHVYMFYVGRFLTGIGVGTLSLVAPVFLTEISEPEIRGMVGVAFQLMVVFGMLFSSVVGYLTSWKWLSIACGIIPVIFSVAILFIPESPRFLVRKGKLIEANKALNWLRSSNEENPSEKVRQELENIQESINHSKDSDFSLKSLLVPSTLRPILITMCLIFFNQFCGISAVNFYTVKIFEYASISGEDSYLSSIIVGIIQVLAVLLASVLVDKVGRRVLLMMSFILMHISLVALGIFFCLKEIEKETLPKEIEIVQSSLSLVILSWLPLVGVVVFNVGYSIGIGSLVWTIMSEILPSNIIGKVYAIETAYNWLLAFLITRFFGVFNEAFKIQNTFWLFAGCCLVACGFVFFTVPETKGKTLEEIEQEFKKGKTNVIISLSKTDLVDV